MMRETATPFETLKEILRHIRDPETLDDHPWTRSLFVQEALANESQLAGAGPGQQLVSAIVGLFPQIKPANPPRRGVRLDPRWGEFGLLAAYYFLPYSNGTSFPSSLLDAWGRIDSAILYFVYDKFADALDEEELEKYRLVGADLEYGSSSTLSDWHKKGIQRLNESILNRERYLSRASAKPSTILNPEEEKPRAKSRGTEIPLIGGGKRFSGRKRVLWLSLTLFLIIALGLGALKVLRIYQQGVLVYRDVARLQALVKGPLAFDTLDKADPALRALQDDMTVFMQEAGPFLWLAPRLDWVPVYGGDLASAPKLAELAEHMVDASLITLDAARPLLDEFNAPDSTLDPAGLTILLVDAQPQFLDAREELERALVVRGEIQVEGLSSHLGGLLMEELDPMLALADEGLSLVTALPNALGATHTGPKTYLLLAQNEDELRPTGGFITSVGKLVLHNGQVIDLDFEGVDNDQEDWTKPYPAAPWQLQEYMNSPVLIFRDSNWFSDYPTSALWAEYLYAYTHSHSVDGVIAFDQQFLVILLGALGPLDVGGAPYAITADNVREYMREAKSPPPGEPIPAGWDRKEFIGEIARAVLLEINMGQKVDWHAFGQAITQALAERHLLLQFDDSELAALIAERGWDNALRPGEGDFLMLTDANIGFNKTSALVSVGLSYDVDLSDPLAPKAALLATHRNNSNPDVTCIHFESGQVRDDYFYPLHRCYWTYLRVYKQQGVELLDASPHAIPGDWMLLDRAVPARVDDLEEEIPGVRGFGTLLVVPGGQSLNTGFQFALPESILTREGASGQISYHLKVQKQPGTLAIPITIRVHLPERASVQIVSLNAIRQDNHLLIETDLRTDVNLSIVFSIP